MTGQDDVVYIPTNAISEQHHYTPPTPSVTILKSGTVRVEGHRPLLSDIRLEKHVPVTTRDGTVLYIDIYRPANAPLGTVPAILAAGPFGKDGGPNLWHFNQWPWRFGCPRIATSGLEKFEGPDPGYWCYHGYAIVHSDCRGVWESQGEVVTMPCQKEGQDNYDMIEFLAAQPWCNGKISMTGNSYLTMTQYYTGAENPPHLACLAPWEGMCDLYEDQVRRGGIPNPGFVDGTMRGDIASATGSKAIDYNAMCYKYPLKNAFWKQYRPDVTQVKCPVYMVSTWTNALHVNGTFTAWQELGSEEKWLRIHNSHEWPDYYNEESVLDLRRFYDFYLKGINNGWNYTPTVRMSIHNPGGTDVIYRPERQFPLKRQLPLKLFLDSTTLTMQESPASAPSTISYDAQTGQVQFRMPVLAPVEFTGYIKLRLWTEAQGSDDMDIFATLAKYNPTTNQVLESQLVDVGRLQDNPIQEQQELIRRHSADPKDCETYFDPGPMGCLRASHRELDEDKSSLFHPVHTHQRELLLQSGEVVPLDIAFWPYGMICNPGEELRLTVSGVHLKEHLRSNDVRPRLRNKGTHVIHTGGNRDSYFLLPLIPAE
ncbi:hydrolase CocE/NonD family protein [Aspergillus sclerotioniger CBS 115572]|uniref:Hydrolase CocE/NonD family protein n=1 Tax=Aspergillus sclerotioniger CBS 115572 TaxID=1450535 RepID=A0A317W3Y2_9EURO|nr:hydrolase CocE/NonD family protein [Aspergillus sclerotioniger CBS 115572]PWY80311.1 hydrolase CocE/NonD family protein [Aspergillus sclerotioniger CBS 115572]